MRSPMRLVVALLVCLLPIKAAADYRVMDVCARYVPTGSSYEVEAQVIRGDELNERVGGYWYNVFDMYVVIFWADSQATIIELNFPQAPGAFPSTGYDQEGREWTVSTSSLCF